MQNTSFSRRLLLPRMWEEGKMSKVLDRMSDWVKKTLNPTKEQVEEKREEQLDKAKYELKLAKVKSEISEHEKKITKNSPNKKGEGSFADRFSKVQQAWDKNFEGQLDMDFNPNNPKKRGKRKNPFDEGYW